MAYDTDGRCHNAEPGTFNHECGKPAVWIGISRIGSRFGFCDDCRQHGYEARGKVRWEPYPVQQQMEAEA